MIDKGNESDGSLSQASTIFRKYLFVSMTGFYFVKKLRLRIVAKTRSHYETNFEGII